MQVPNVWLRPPNQRREADAAKALLSVPDGDHLTLLNVYNNYILSMSPPLSFILSDCSDLHIKSWTWDNYLSARALSQADNVRTQLLRIMERNDLDIVSINNKIKLYDRIKQALVCGFSRRLLIRKRRKARMSLLRTTRFGEQSSHASETVSDSRNC